MSLTTETERVCRHLLMSSPPGQFDLVLTDLLNILNSHDTESNNTSTPGSSAGNLSGTVLSNDFVASVRAEYERLHLLNLEEEDDKENDSVLIQLRQDLADYANTCYGNKGVICHHSVTHDSSTKTILLALRAERRSLPNCHAGAWTASYRYDPVARELRGHARVHAHTFEHGNVQLIAERTMDPVSGLDPSDVLHRIGAWETDVCEQQLSQGFYQTTTEHTLKRMRRLLPVSRTKMDWNVHTHRMTRNLNTNLGNH